MVSPACGGGKGYPVVALWVAMGLALSVLPGIAPVHTAYAQQPKRTMNGFEVSGRFLEVWSRQGSEAASVYVNGLPITESRSEISIEDGRAYETQWFERARYELHPENPRPNDALLGRLGAWDAEGRGKVDPATGKAANPGDEPFLGVERPQDADGTSKLWFPETRHTLTGKLLEYWWRYGGLAQFGYPLSEPFEETSRADGKRYTVQYFERARMEMHPEKPAPYEVELGLLGVEQVGMRAVAGEELPVAPQQGVRSTRDRMRVYSPQEPRSLTFADDSSISKRIRSLVEDGLVGRDDNDNLFPLDAWYVPTVENGGARFAGEGEDRHLVVKYKLRPGIKWSDGQEMTSNDAVFAYRLMLHPEAAVPPNVRAEHLRLQSVDNPDRRTVIYRYRSLRQVTALYDSLPNKEDYQYLKAFVEQKKPVISRLYSEIGSILPEHVLGKVPPAQIPDSPIALDPVGTGPWQVERHVRGQHVILVTNEHYGLTSKPAIKTIEVLYVTDYNTIWGHFTSGLVDLGLGEGLVIPPADAATLKAGGMSVVTRPGAAWEHLDFYLDYEPFNDRLVREAITVAINRQRLVDVAFRGAGRVMNSVVPSGVYYSLEHPDFARKFPEIAAKYKLPIYAYDPGRAALLLESAGWKCLPGVSNSRNCDNKPRVKGGVGISFEYATTINPVRQQVQALVQQDLAEVGIKADIKAYPSNVFFGQPGPRTDGTTKLAQLAWVTGRESDFELWRCPPIWGRECMYGFCVRSYCNDNLDRAADRFNTEVNLDAQLTAAAEAQFILMYDLPVIPLVQRPNIEIVTDSLVNYKITGSTTSSFWNARQWYFK